MSENHGPSEIFHQAGRSFVSEVESSVLDPPIGNVVVDHTPVTYQVVEKGTKRRKISLVYSIGFTYNVHSKRSYATYWQCTVRPKNNPCRASVIERNGTYQTGKSMHNHQVEAGSFTAVKVVAAVKKMALQDKFRPASAIVDEVIEHAVIVTFNCNILPDCGSILIIQRKVNNIDCGNHLHSIV